MPITIGGKPESHFSDPIGLLTDCHRRIERFLSVLVQVAAQAGEGELTDERRTALETALRYFREAAPNHTADEEDTLFPRMRMMDRPEAKAVLASVDSLEQDHERAQEMHDEADRLGQAWLASGTISTADAALLSAVLAQLDELYRGHIAVEEQEVFPVAARLLAAPDREAIGGEMAARRGLSQGLPGKPPARKMG
ncbi:MAG TPA: hemerythrin domain-containing protein [Bryobacteraceae bacterium]|nr:hemerythrin domain-containing protein [Bryobacteraceae bacterium]